MEGKQGGWRAKKWNRCLAFFLLSSIHIPPLKCHRLSCTHNKQRNSFLLPFTQPLGGRAWLLACLSPPGAASLFATALLGWERAAAGVTPTTLWLPVTQDSSFSAGHALLMLALDVPLFGLLTWYLDRALPQGCGQRLAPWFPLLPSYWRGGGLSSGGDSGGAAAAAAGGSLADGRGGGGGHSSGGSAISVRGLAKVFASPGGGKAGGAGGVVALDGLTFDARRGAVTALLGQNGAGKTTAINILTGVLEATSGAAYVDGLPAATAMGAIRRRLGVCPQFDLLWPQLTVAEHLRLYWALRGGAARDARAAAEAAAAEVRGGRQGASGGGFVCVLFSPFCCLSLPASDVHFKPPTQRTTVSKPPSKQMGLTAKLRSPAGDLSGGQRRKLSVAIAFLGAPPVVILDEPTAGMDPVSRRATWDAVRARRAASAVLLTTHSMEEADRLADDVVIMAAGRVAAAGTPLELKARYGVGYTLTVVLSAGVDAGAGAGGGDAGAAAAAAQADAARRVAELVTRRAPGARVLSAAGAELVMRLPRGSSGAATPAAGAGAAAPSSAGAGAGAAGVLPAVLRDLERIGRRELGLVASYGVAVTTLEDVFLTLAAGGGSGGGTGGSGGSGGSGGGGQESAARDGGAAAPPATGGGGGCSLEEPLLAARGRPDGGGAAAPEERHEQRRLAGAALYLHQLRALLVKRALCAR